MPLMRARNGIFKDLAVGYDILCLALLFRYGGVYMDVDVITSGKLNIEPVRNSTVNRPSPALLSRKLLHDMTFSYANVFIVSKQK